MRTSSTSVTPCFRKSFTRMGNNSSSICVHIEGLRSVSPSLFDAKVQEEREWAAVIWLGRFYVIGMPGDEGYLRFGPPDASAWIINPTDRTRKFDLTMAFGPLSSGSFRMRLTGLVDDDFNLERK